MKIKSSSLLVLYLSVLFFFLFTMPLNLYAQQGESVLYIDSITEDEEGNKLSFPNLVFAEPVNKEIYIISQGKIIIYTSDLFPIFTLDKRKGIENVLGLTIDMNGNIYVAQGATKENSRQRISVLDACFKWESDIYFDGFDGVDSFIPNNLAVDKNGNLYVAGSFFPGVLMLNKQGKLLEIITAEEDSKKVKFDNVKIDETGKLYLISAEQSHIYVYDENRRFLFKFGEKGGSTGKLSRPLSVGIDNQRGRMYVVDYMRHTISAYDKDGNYLFEFGGLGWGEGWFQYPTDIAVDSAGRILVADTFNDRIQVFQVNE